MTFCFCNANSNWILQIIHIFKNICEVIQWINKIFSFAIQYGILSGDKNELDLICLQHYLMIIILICDFLNNASRFKESRAIKNWKIFLIINILNFNLNFIRNFSFRLAPNLSNFWRLLANDVIFLIDWIFNDDATFLFFCNKRKFSE